MQPDFHGLRVDPVAFDTDYLPAVRPVNDTKDGGPCNRRWSLHGSYELACVSGHGKLVASLPHKATQIYANEQAPPPFRPFADGRLVELDPVARIEMGGED